MVINGESSSFGILWRFPILFSTKNYRWRMWRITGLNDILFEHFIYAIFDNFQFRLIVPVSMIFNWNSLPLINSMQGISVKRGSSENKVWNACSIFTKSFHCSSVIVVSSQAGCDSVKFSKIISFMLKPPFLPVPANFKTSVPKNHDQLSSCMIKISPMIKKSPFGWSYLSTKM